MFVTTGALSSVLGWLRRERGGVFGTVRGSGGAWFWFRFRPQASGSILKHRTRGGQLILMLLDCRKLSFLGYADSVNTLTVLTLTSGLHRNVRGY